MYQFARLLAVGGFAATLLTGLALEAEAAPLTCGGKRVTIVGTDGDDTLLGTNRADVIHARAGNDRVRGRGGNDLVCGGHGSDRLWGGDGNDRLYGGRDRLVVDTDGPDRHVGKLGDVLDGGAGDDRLDGGADDRAADPAGTRPTSSAGRAPRVAYAWTCPRAGLSATEPIAGPRAPWSCG